MLRDTKILSSVLTTLGALELRMAALKASFDAGERDFTSVEDQGAIRRALLTYLSCRRTLFRIAWYYRAPRGVSGGGAAAELDAQGFLLGYVAALELVRRAMQLIDTFDGSPRAQRKLNEGDPVFDVPTGLYDHIRRNLASSDVYDELLEATRRFESLQSARPMLSGEQAACEAQFHEAAARGRAVVARLADKLWNYKWDSAWARIERSAEDSRYEISKLFGGMIGGVHIREGDLGDGLITDEQVEWLRKTHLRPGDILLQRRNWALTNVLLPGYWTHVALYTGEPPQDVIEALAPGVIRSTLEVSVGGADAVCVLRPRLSAGQTAEALARAHVHLGKPYDFDFDFFSADRLVCTELVHQAYDGFIRFPLVEVLGRKTLPAVEIVKKWRDERGQGEPELEFVCLLDVDMEQERAVEGDAEDLADTLTRPALALLQADQRGSKWPKILLIVLASLFLLSLVLLRKRA